MDNIKVSRLYKFYENKNLHVYEKEKETQTHIILDAELFRYAHFTVRTFSPPFHLIAGFSAFDEATLRAPFY